MFLTIVARFPLICFEDRQFYDEFTVVPITANNSRHWRINIKGIELENFLRNNGNIWASKLEIICVSQCSVKHRKATAVPSSIWSMLQLIRDTKDKRNFNIWREFFVGGWKQSSFKLFTFFQFFGLCMVYNVYIHWLALNSRKIT